MWRLPFLLLLGPSVAFMPQAGLPNRAGTLPPLRSTEASTEQDLYALLQVDANATPAEIKTAYFQIAKATHPDMDTSSAEAAASFQQVTEAYRVLKDPGTRSTYDQGLKMKQFVQGVKGGSNILSTLWEFAGPAIGKGVEMGVEVAVPFVKDAAVFTKDAVMMPIINATSTAWAARAATTTLDRATAAQAKSYEAAAEAARIEVEAVQHAEESERCKRELEKLRQDTAMAEQRLGVVTRRVKEAEVELQPVAKEQQAKHGVFVAAQARSITVQSQLRVVSTELESSRRAVDKAEKAFEAARLALEDKREALAAAKANHILLQCSQGEVAKEEKAARGSNYSATARLTEAEAVVNERKQEMSECSSALRMHKLAENQTVKKIKDLAIQLEKDARKVEQWKAKCLAYEKQSAELFRQVQGAAIEAAPEGRSSTSAPSSGDTNAAAPAPSLSMPAATELSSRKDARVTPNEKREEKEKLDEERAEASDLVMQATESVKALNELVKLQNSSVRARSTAASSMADYNPYRESM
ncbi:unnamed protein product [Chrysoparadoxa australica]